MWGMLHGEKEIGCSVFMFVVIVVMVGLVWNCVCSGG